MRDPVSLGTFKSQNLRAAETMDRLAYLHSTTQHGGWGFLIAAALIFTIAVLATDGFASAINLPV